MRKNILLFGHSYATQFIDISNQYTQLFDPARFKVTVAYLVGEPDESIRKKHVAEEVLFLNFSRPAVGGLKISAIKKLYDLCRANQYDIVIAQRYKPTYIMLWVAKFISIPRLFFVMHELGTLKHLSRKLLINLLVQKNMIFAGVSNAVRDDMRKDLKNIPADRIITLYNMIDVPATEAAFLSRTQARETLKLNESDFIFGNIGRLAKNKDQTTLLQAFATISSYCPNAKLIIIGDGALETDLKQQARALNIAEKVIFTGFLAEGYQFLPAFDVLISASIQEAFGRVLLEAMLAKTPIIATSVNGVPEVLGETGNLIDAKDITQMANAMLNLYRLSENDRQEVGRQGYLRATKEFSLHRFSEVFWNINQ